MNITCTPHLVTWTFDGAGESFATRVLLPPSYTDERVRFAVSVAETGNREREDLIVVETVTEVVR